MNITKIDISKIILKYYNEDVLVLLLTMHTDDLMHSFALTKSEGLVESVLNEGVGNARLSDAIKPIESSNCTIMHVRDSSTNECFKTLLKLANPPGGKAVELIKSSLTDIIEHKSFSALKYQAVHSRLNGASHISDAPTELILHEYGLYDVENWQYKELRSIDLYSCGDVAEILVESFQDCAEVRIGFTDELFNEIKEAKGTGSFSTAKLLRFLEMEVFPGRYSNLTIKGTFNTCPDADGVGEGVKVSFKHMPYLVTNSFRKLDIDGFKVRPLGTSVGYLQHVENDESCYGVVLDLSNSIDTLRLLEELANTNLTIYIIENDVMKLYVPPAINRNSRNRNSRNRYRKSRL